jgi:hypothetical protein
MPKFTVENYKLLYNTKINLSFKYFRNLRKRLKEKSILILSKVTMEQLLLFRVKSESMMQREELSILFFKIGLFSFIFTFLKSKLLILCN